LGVKAGVLGWHLHTFLCQMSRIYGSLILLEAIETAQAYNETTNISALLLVSFNMICILCIFLSGFDFVVSAIIIIIII
jgi:hypothetical protein